MTKAQMKKIEKKIEQVNDIVSTNELRCAHKKYFGDLDRIEFRNGKLTAVFTYCLRPGRREYDAYEMDMEFPDRVLAFYARHGVYSNI